MKIKDCFVVRNIAGINTVISSDATSTFDGMITLNDTALFMWQLLKEGSSEEELINALMKEYEVARDVVENDVCNFIEKLRSIDVFI